MRLKMFLGEGYKVVNIDKLSDNEIRALDVLLDKYSLWTDLSASTNRQSYIKNTCGSEFCRVILSRISSPYLTFRIKETIASISQNKSFEDAFKFFDGCRMLSYSFYDYGYSNMGWSRFVK